jgi:hypothetical protein
VKTTETQKLQGGEEKNLTALIWQGQILDLLGRREEALAAYDRAGACDFNNFHTRHDQYGIVLTRDYLNQLLEKPFVRVDNHDED